MDFINWFFHVTELFSSRWEWLSFTSSVYTYTTEFDASYDPNGPQAQAVDVGGFRCFDTLNFSSPPLHLGIRFQRFKPVGSSRKWISKYLNHFFLEVMKAVWDRMGQTWVSCYRGGRPKGVVITVSSKAISLAPLSLWSQYTIWRLGTVPFQQMGRSRGGSETMYYYQPRCWVFSRNIQPTLFHLIFQFLSRRRWYFFP